MSEGISGGRQFDVAAVFDELPQPGQEYLSMDVMAFSGSPVSGRWRLPIAAFELENHRTDDRVGYSLWKVLCLRTDLRVVFAFRRDWEESRRSVEAIGRAEAALAIGPRRGRTAARSCSRSADPRGRSTPSRCCRR